MKPLLFTFQMAGDGLHRSISNGIPAGTIMLMEGSDGSGKSILSQRLCYGFLRNGYKVTFISTELTTKNFIDQMESIKYSVVDDLLSQQLRYVPVYPTIGKIRERKDFLTRFIKAKELFQTEIIIVDSFSSLIYEELDATNVLTALSVLKKVVTMNKAVILTIDPDVINVDFIHHFRSSAGVYFNLEQVVDEGQQVNRILIKRFLQAQGQVGSIVGFRVVPGAGLIVDITAIS